MCKSDQLEHLIRSIDCEWTLNEQLFVLLLTEHVVSLRWQIVCIDAHHDRLVLLLLEIVQHVQVLVDRGVLLKGVDGGVEMRLVSLLGQCVAEDRILKILEDAGVRDNLLKRLLVDGDP